MFINDLTGSELIDNYVYVDERGCRDYISADNETTVFETEDILDNGILYFKIMYIVYEEHIEQLEKENEELEKEVLILRRRLAYYKTVVEENE